MAGIDLTSILNIAVKGKASDVHLKAGVPPILRIHGSLVPVKNHERLAPDEVSKMALRLMNETQKEWHANNSGFLDVVLTVRKRPPAAPGSDPATVAAGS